MTRIERRERVIRQNPNNVRFDDLDLLLCAYGFTRRNRGTSHQIFGHPLIPYHVNIPVHGATVKSIYVSQALASQRYAAGAGRMTTYPLDLEENDRTTGVIEEPLTITADVEEAKQLWIAAALADGKPVPAPSDLLIPTR